MRLAFDRAGCADGFYRPSSGACKSRPMPTAGESNRVPSRPQPGEDTAARLDGGSGRRADAPSREREPEFRSVLFDGATGGVQRRDGEQPAVLRRSQPRPDRRTRSSTAEVATSSRRSSTRRCRTFDDPFRQEVFADLELPDGPAVGGRLRRPASSSHATKRSSARCARTTAGSLTITARACSSTRSSPTARRSRHSRPASHATDLRARGLLGLRDYLAGYSTAPRTANCANRRTPSKHDLDQIRYSFLLNGSRDHGRPLRRAARLQRRDRRDLRAVPPDSQRARAEAVPRLGGLLGDRRAAPRRQGPPRAVSAAGTLLL